MFALLFAFSVVDLAFRIVLAVRSGPVADPTVVVGFIDTGLLLLIIVEVHRTVLASLRESETRRIVRLIIYTGVIATARKAIIFRISEYDCESSAFRAASDPVIMLALVALVAPLFAEQAHSGGLMPGDD